VIAGKPIDFYGPLGEYASSYIPMFNKLGYTIHAYFA